MEGNKILAHLSVYDRTVSRISKILSHSQINYLIYVRMSQVKHSQTLRHYFMVKLVKEKKVEFIYIRMPKVEQYQSNMFECFFQSFSMLKNLRQTITRFYL